VWPTVHEVRDSFSGWFSGRSIPGPPDSVNQEYLQKLYSRWGGEPVGRELIMPHIKTYLRFNNSTKEIAWFLLTSSNLSKVRSLF
jgi:hypothetical protein